MNNITDILSGSPQMDFYEAIKNVVLGKKIHRIEWKDKEFYGIIDNEILKLHKPDGKLYQWIINIGDLTGNDWIII